MSAHVFEFIKRVGEKRLNARLAMYYCLINSIIQEHGC